MTRCLIIDDEPLARQLMESHVRQVKSLQLVGTCETALEAFEWLHREPVDLLFLDIQMPGITGLNFLKSIKHPPKVIFTTAYMEYAVEAFELEAVDYLLKPITFERFIKAIQKVVAPKEVASLAQAQAPGDAIFIKVQKRLLRIAYPDIFYIEGFGDYIKVVTANAVHTSYFSLNKIGELLPEQQFIRIHKSFIINVGHIQFVEGSLVRILDKELPLGVTYKDSLYKKLGQE
ncbi:DNA-binding response regulator [Paraflavitalea soli]|uniref:DNA-binding response regulator n=1 Tax=Paraflavitalea soli TaxID=2315862 RepID=A0A3B7N1E4_9BACT|nr:response regulator transcription factor [Paraflavitalea soli]AXY77875.1 DNA-binding response regulator [Paraflavitalea soli]